MNMNHNMIIWRWRFM